MGERFIVVRFVVILTRASGARFAIPALGGPCERFTDVGQDGILRAGWQLARFTSPKGEVQGKAHATCQPFFQPIRPATVGSTWGAGWLPTCPT